MWHDPGRPSSPEEQRVRKIVKKKCLREIAKLQVSQAFTNGKYVYCTLTTLSLATRTDCSFCRPSEPLWPQTLVHLILGGSWNEPALGRRVKRQGSRTVLERSSLMVWWVTFRIFTTVSALVKPEKRRGEINQCFSFVNEVTKCFVSLSRFLLVASLRVKHVLSLWVPLPHQIFLVVE